MMLYEHKLLKAINQIAGKIHFLLYLDLLRAGLTQWWEHWSSTNVAWVRSLNPPSYVG